MSGQHTPGPWLLYTVPTSVGSCHKIGPFPSARTSNTDPTYACVYADGVRIGIDDSLPRAKELTANARLMSAAPELLEACIAFLASDTADHNAIVGRDEAGSALNAAGVARIQMRAAIAKATASTTDAGVAG